MSQDQENQAQAQTAEAPKSWAEKLNEQMPLPAGSGFVWADGQKRFRATKGAAKREPINFVFPQFDIDGLKLQLAQDDEKLQEFILSTLNGVVSDYVASVIDDAIDDEKTDAEIQAMLDARKGEFTLSAIAALPAAVRGRRGIPTEMWEAFYKHYEDVQLNLRADKLEKVKVDNHIKAFKRRGQNYIGQADMLQMLENRLDEYVTADPDGAENFAECIAKLKEKFKDYKEIKKAEVSAL